MIGSKYLYQMSHGSQVITGRITQAPNNSITLQGTVSILSRSQINFDPKQEGGSGAHLREV